MRFRVVDIETIPDLSVWTPGEDQWKLTCSKMIDVGGVPPPSWHVPPPSWQSVAAKKDSIACVEKVEPFPPPQAHRVVAIAYVDIVMNIDKSPRYRCDGGFSNCQWALAHDNENTIEVLLLMKFSDAMVATNEGNISLVTWNGRGFDLPVLSMRSLKLGVPFGWYYSDRDMRYRYSENGHLDLMDFLGDYGAARLMKLDDVARLIGLPGKVAGGMTGASVHDIYKSSLTYPELAIQKMAAVGRYCLQDAIQTALIFLRTRFHLGRIDRDEYNNCLSTFIESDFITKAIDIDWDKVKL